MACRGVKAPELFPPHFVLHPYPVPLPRHLKRMTAVASRRPDNTFQSVREPPSRPRTVLIPRKATHRQGRISPAPTSSTTTVPPRSTTSTCRWQRLTVGLTPTTYCQTMSETCPTRNSSSQTSTRRQGQNYTTRTATGWVTSTPRGTWSLNRRGVEQTATAIVSIIADGRVLKEYNQVTLSGDATKVFDFVLEVSSDESVSSIDVEVTSEN